MSWMAYTDFLSRLRIAAGILLPLNTRTLLLYPGGQDCIGAAGVDAYNQIMEMLTDQYNDLQAEGFQASAPDSVNLFAVEICKMDLQRIFDNLFSNIRKYADKAHSISVSVNELTDSVEIALENNIRTQSNADRTGIGLPTVQSLLSSYGGRMEIDQTEHKFTTLLLLKKVK